MKINKNKIPKSYTSITISKMTEIKKLLNIVLKSTIFIHPQKINKPIVLYGAGSLGQMAKEFFDYFKIDFKYIVDKNAEKYINNNFWKNTKIIFPKDVPEKDKHKYTIIICIVTTPIIELLNQLNKDGWEDIRFFYDVTELYKNKYPINNGWFKEKFSLKEVKNIKKIYSKFSDDISRIQYTQFLAWRKMRLELLFENIEINTTNRFFIPKITKILTKKEIFVDCGAHIGAVIEKFLQITNNKYDSIYAIEPDKSNFKKLNEKLKIIPNTHPIKYALSNKNSNMNFYDGFGFASKLNKNGKNTIKTVTLDNLNITATFIKLHLEGGELNALTGATNTINKYRPIVVITAYHNSDGIEKIPSFLINNTKKYKLYFRLHSYGGTGAVFYAIPIERIRGELYD